MDARPVPGSRWALPRLNLGRLEAMAAHLTQRVAMHGLDGTAEDRFATLYADDDTANPP